VLLTAEDHRFHLHGGVDLLAVLRALWRRLTSDRREGASTVEMQLVRVLSGRFERTVRRKVREAMLATLLGSAVPRTDVPALYLRVAFYGTGMNGFGVACRRLGIAPGKMTERQAAELIARLKYPQPRRPSAASRHRINRRAQYLLRLHSRSNRPGWRATADGVNRATI
jgi:penicillin-binding protein 1A